MRGRASSLLGDVLVPDGPAAGRHFTDRLVLEDAEIAAAERILAVTIVTVAFSILAHGVTAAPAARWFGALARRMGESEENKPVSEMPTRTGTVKASETV